MRFGVGAARTRRGPTYSPEVSALLAAFTTPPDETVLADYIALIDGCVADGVYSELDELYIPAHDSQAARVNFARPSFVMTAVNAPTFVPFRGWTGDGATSYLDTNFRPRTDALRYSQNDCHMGVWIGTDASATNRMDYGSSAVGHLNGRNSANARVRMNTSTALSDLPLPVATSVGHLMWVRTGATSAEAFKNGVSIGTSTVASTPPSVAKNFILCGSNFDNTPLSFSTRQFVAGHSGAALNATQRTALRNRINTYLAAVGAASA